MSSHYKLNLASSFDMTLNVLSVLGHWPPDLGRRATFAYKIYSLFFISFWYVAFLLTEFINTVLAIKDLEKLVGRSFLMLTHSAQILKLYGFIRYNRKMKNFIKSLNDSICQPRSSRQHLILNKTINVTKNTYLLLLTMGIVTCTLWGIFPFIESGNTVRLPLSAWYPLNTQQSPAFEIIFTYQLIGATINAATNITMDCTIAGMICHIAGQLDILNYALENIEEVYQRNVQGESSVYINMKKTVSVQNQTMSACDKHNTCKLIHEELIRCIKHHKKIMR